MPSSAKFCSRRCLWILGGIVFVVATLTMFGLVLEQNAPFADVIAEFERQDQLAPPASGAIGFVGSSSFRLPASGFRLPASGFGTRWRQTWRRFP
jgi:hypothetical protein